MVDMTAFQQTLSDDRLQAAMRRLAVIIQSGDETVWPLFDRLDAEAQQRGVRDDRITRLLSTSRK